MSALILASTGSYPRIGDSPELQILRRTIAGADRGEKTAADLADAENEMTRRAIEEQVRAGVELVTDGQIRWYDPISHLPGKMDGVEIKGLLRFFDTNTYFRQPVLKTKPARRNGTGVLVEEYKFARNALGMLPTSSDRAGKLSIKPVLTGPYTLARFSLAEDAGMKPLEARAQAYAEALAGEIRALADAGAELVQVDEPAVIKYREDWDVFGRALAAVVKAAREGGKKIRIALYVYFHDATPLYEKLAGLPVDVLGLDFTYNQKLVDKVAAAGSPVPLALGLVDGRNTKLEQPAAVARQIERLLRKIAGGRAYLGPSSGLEYLPRERAFQKLEVLGKIRAAVQG
jgi:5-methyltetrahydropteroyltriglutamate--homocysteine methyltransferase